MEPYQINEYTINMQFIKTPLPCSTGYKVPHLPKLKRRRNSIKKNNNKILGFRRMKIWGQLINLTKF